MQSAEGSRTHRSKEGKSMPYTLMIADDDSIIRKGLSHLVPWDSMGFELIGVFEDGRALLNALEARTPDVILTDIRMHEISGLDIAREIQKRGLSTSVVVLSGYREFEYATQAMRYGVKEYLSKPISIDQIKETFTRIHSQLEADTQLQVRNRKISERMDALSYSIEQQLLKDAYEGRLVNQALFDQRMADIGYSAQDIRRRSLLIEVICDEGAMDVVADAMNLVDEESVFYTVSRTRSALTGLLMQKHCSPAPDQGGAQLIRERLSKLTGQEVSVSLLVAFPDLRALSLYRSESSAASPAAQAKAYISLHFAEPITLNDVAARIYVNPVYLSRVFREKTGVTFTEALTRTRMEAVMHRLQETGDPISLIATDCGYRNIKYFYSQFKRYAGMSPSEWRIRHAEGEKKA